MVIYTPVMFSQVVDMSALDDIFDELPAKLTVEEVARALNIRENTVRRLLTTGADPLPGFKLGGVWLILRDELKPWLLRRHTAPRE